MLIEVYVKVEQSSLACIDLYAFIDPQTLLSSILTIPSFSFSMEVNRLISEQHKCLSL